MTSQCYVCTFLNTQDFFQKTNFSNCEFDVHVHPQVRELLLSQVAAALDSIVKIGSSLIMVP